MGYTARRYKKGNEESYTLGTTLTIELLKQKPEICKQVYLHSDLSGLGLETIITLCNKNSIPYEVNNKVFNVLSQKENCFAIGIFEIFQSELVKNTDHVVLVNPSNNGNLGTIMRSMCGFGVKDLGIITPSVDIFDPKTVRSSMGAIFDLRVKYYSSFDEYLEDVGARPFYPFMLQAKSSLTDFPFEHPSTLVYGNEASGLPRDFLEKGYPLIINHSEEIDSLNLPIAVSISLYEFTKKRFN